MAGIQRGPGNEYEAYIKTRPIVIVIDFVKLFATPSSLLVLRLLHAVN